LVEAVHKSDQTIIGVSLTGCLKS